MPVGRAVGQAPLVDVDDSDRVGGSGALPPAGDADNRVADAQKSFLDAELDAVLKR